MQYKLVEASSIKELEKEVNELIEQGYRPYGSLYVLQDQSDWRRADWFYREMIKD